MYYFSLIFAVLFLPAALIVYQLLPQKYRYIALLVFNVIFFSYTGMRRFIYPLLAGGITFFAGLLLEYLFAKQKERVKAEEDKENKKKIKKSYLIKTRTVMIVSIAALVLLILHVKYTDFFIENINSIAQKMGNDHRIPLKEFVLPLGISFYTLQSIGYIVDVYWRKITAEKNFLKVLTYITFFPTIMEGPIVSFLEVKEDLFSGKGIVFDNVYSGYIRLLYGCMKKLVIADRLNPAVKYLFTEIGETNGTEVACAAVLFTVMEYMDFSGSIDMVIGVAKMFGIKLPENFKQPFFAKNATEFWRRWHITLGVWLKTYIFYPVSMSGLVRKFSKFAKEKKLNNHFKNMVVSAISLLPVWLINGLWHGPSWTYISYGIYYFIVIMLELIFEPLGDLILEKLKTTRENPVVTVIRVLKNWIVIFLGEIVFRVSNMFGAVVMYRKFFTEPGRVFSNGAFLNWGINGVDYVIALIFLLVVLAVDIWKEKNKGELLSDRIMLCPAYLRVAAVLFLAVSILILGLYGPGFLEVDLIYANF